MAKLQLNDGEKLLGEAQASHVKTVMLFPQANPGRLYVTDRRVVFEPTQGRMSSALPCDPRPRFLFSHYFRELL